MKLNAEVLTGGNYIDITITDEYNLVVLTMKIGTNKNDYTIENVGGRDYLLKKIVELLQNDICDKYCSEHPDDEFCKDVLKSKDESDNEHKLTIISLHDAKAECSCGWYYVFTGERTRKEVEKEYNKHINYNFYSIRL